MPNITINTESMKESLKRAILAKIADKSGSFTHTNKDRNFSPSQWNSDNNERKTLETSGSIAVEQDTVKVILSYDTKTI